MAATINLDHFQILWFCEGFIGKSHLRWGGYEMMVNDIFPQLNDKQRDFVYTYLKRDLSWHWEHVDEHDNTPYNYWLRMMARYNPTNQYLINTEITVDGKVKKESFLAYKFEDHYWINWYRRINEQSIKSIEQQPYKKCDNEYCKSKDKCIRYLEKDNPDTSYKNLEEKFACHPRYIEKCDFLIEN